MMKKNSLHRNAPAPFERVYYIVGCFVHREIATRNGNHGICRVKQILCTKQMKPVAEMLHNLWRDVVYKRKGV